MLFYNVPSDPDRVHDYVRTQIKTNMRCALRGEFSYMAGRLPTVWENFHREVEEVALFRYFEEAGLVRIESEPDDISTDDLFGDCFDEIHADSVPGGMRTIKAQEREALRRLEAECQWVIVAESLSADSPEWEMADTLGGFVGDDFEGSGYEPQVYMSAVLQLAEARGFEFPPYFYSKDGSWLRQCQRVWEMYEAMHAA